MVPLLVRAWFEKNYRTTLRAALAGVLVGLLSGIGFFLIYWNDCSAVVGTAYEPFPALPLPWPAAFPLALPAWLRSLLSLWWMLSPFAVGCFAVWLVRPVSRAGDIAVGAGSGLMCGLTVLAVGMGAFFIQTFALAPARADWASLAEAAEPAAQPVAVLAERYPDLLSVPAHTQMAFVARKAQADTLARLPLAVLVTLVYSVFFPLVSVLAASLTASWLRGEKPRPGDDQSLTATWFLYAGGWAMLMFLSLALLKLASPQGSFLITPALRSVAVFVVWFLAVMTMLACLAGSEKDLPRSRRCLCWGCFLVPLLYFVLRLRPAGRSCRWPSMSWYTPARWWPCTAGDAASRPR